MGDRPSFDDRPSFHSEWGFATGGRSVRTVPARQREPSAESDLQITRIRPIFILENSRVVRRLVASTARRR